MITHTMSTHLFDTHTFIKKLIAVGFTERQAETLAEEQVIMLENTLTTKRDLKELEMRITIKLGGLMVVVLSVLTTIFKFT